MEKVMGLGACMAASGGTACMQCAGHFKVTADRYYFSKSSGSPTLALSKDVSGLMSTTSASKLQHQ